MTTEPRTVTRLHTNADRLRRPPMEWNIEGILPPTGLCQIYGETGKGKSFVAIDLALRIANGMKDWYGYAINKSGPVVYVFMEGVHDQQARIDAWLIAHPGTSADQLYTLDEEAFTLGDPKSTGELLLDIKLAEIEPVLLVIDTQALASGGIEENDNGEMGRVLAFLKRWSFSRGYPILTVHHTGKDVSRGARGASAWKAGLDLEIHVRDEEIKATKVKGGPSTPYMGFKLTLSGKSAWAKPAFGSDGLRELGISQNILDYLRANPAQLTMKQVLEHFGNGAKVRHAFEELMHDDVITRVEIERKEGTKTFKRDVWVADDAEVLDLSDEGEEGDFSWRQ